MSDSFPTLPPSGSTPPPPPGFTPPPAPGFTPPAPPTHGGMPTPPPAYPPAGYTQYGGGGYAGPLAGTAGVRKATIVLFWVASVAAIVLGIVAYNRGGVLDDFLQGDASLSDVDSADGQVAGLALLMLAAQIAAAITLAVWSHRTTGNAKKRGAEVSPGLAAGGWFIPIGNYWVPWSQLRKASSRFGPAPSSLMIWQLLFLAQAVLSVVARIVGDLDLETSDEDAVSKLHNQGFLFIGTGVALVIATVIAGRAMKDVDALTTPNA